MIKSFRRVFEALGDTASIVLFISFLAGVGGPAVALLDGGRKAAAVILSCVLCVVAIGLALLAIFYYRLKNKHRWLRDEHRRLEEARGQLQDEHRWL